jgi:hypothetical protein
VTGVLVRSRHISGGSMIPLRGSPLDDSQALLGRYYRTQLYLLQGSAGGDIPEILMVKIEAKRYHLPFKIDRIAQTRSKRESVFKSFIKSRHLHHHSHHHNHDHAHQIRHFSQTDCPARSRSHSPPKSSGKSQRNFVPE